MSMPLFVVVHEWVGVKLPDLDGVNLHS
jgi:hypothetical protein